jgi:cytochrome P450
MLADLLVHRAYDFVKPPKISGFLRHVLGDGLIVVEGEQHKFLRKSTMPAFAFRHIKDLYPMMWEKAVLMTTTIQDEMGKSDSAEDKELIEVSTWASKATLDIIGIAGLGREFNVLKRAQDPLLDVYEQLLEPAPEKLLFAMSSFVFGLSFVRLLPWKMNRLFKYLTDRLNEICLPMMQEKKELIAKSKDGHFDVLSLLIKSDQYSDGELKDQLLTFLAAGYVTNPAYRAEKYVGHDSTNTFCQTRNHIIRFHLGLLFVGKAPRSPGKAKRRNSRGFLGR